MKQINPNCEREMLDFAKACFTTIAVNKGKARDLKLHYKRLVHDMQIIKLEFTITKEEFTNIIKEYIQIENIVDGVVRFSCGRETYYLRKRNNPYVELSPVRLKLNPLVRDGNNKLYQAKTNNFLANHLDLQQAKEEKFDEVLQLNLQGLVCECACANIFIVKDQQILTPSLDVGILNGTVRQKIITLFNVTEADLELEDLLTCDEMFITNSLRLVSPVVLFQDRQLPIGELSKKINQALRME